MYAIECKTAICSLGWHPQRLTNNSTGNPYNCWHMPYNTGSYFVLPMQIGASLVNIDISGRATLIPKGWGAPGMNGINNMGGKEINALGERFMFKYDPMGENGKRRNQVMGTWQEQVEGNGPPFYMDMTHFSDEDVHHLQYVLMPADKETYLDYCAARGIEFKKAPLEVEVSEMTVSGMLLADDRLDTTVKGLFAGSNFTSFSGAMCCGYVAAFHAANDAASTEMGVIDDAEAQAEHDRILAPWERKGTNLLKYNDFEDPIRQIMDYYAKYRRNMAGMRLALEKLALVESYTDRVVATNNHELMRLHEAFDLLELCRAHLEACLQRKESGRGMYQLSDYPEKDPELAKGLVLTRKDGAFQFGWTE